MPPSMRLIDLSAFSIIGKSTYISGPDNEQFGRFWEESRAAGLLDVLRQAQRGCILFSGPHTNSALLGVSRVEQNPAVREFNYMIAVEAPTEACPPGLDCYQVPAARWAVFECRGEMPGALVASEIYAFMEWLPGSEYHHALAPEMEVYPPSDEPYMEFWLPVEENIPSSSASSTPRSMPPTSAR